MKGRAVSIKEYGKPFVIDEYDVPDPEPGAVVLRITQAGICGSDLHTGRGDHVNVPLPPQTYDGAYLRAFEEIVPSLLKRFEPDVLVTQLGVDTHYTDPLASLALTTTGQQTLYGLLGEMAPKWLALGGGGYALDVVPRSWALAFGEMAGYGLQKSLPKAYREKYGGKYLRDQQGPDINDAVRFRVDEAVDSVIVEVRRAHNIN